MAGSTLYRRLDPGKIIETLEQLEARIGERFPKSGLRNVCQELTSLARESSAKIERAARPNYALRIGSAALLLLGASLLVYVASIIEVKRDSENLFGVLEGIDAAMNTLVLMGAGAFFLATLESRWNRQMSMTDLHELRSIIHVIDMHQLTKDPSAVATVATGTASSPQRQLSPFELTRYLDYCSEMLSLAAQVAALHAQGTKDAVVIDAASDLGQITSNLSNKIWQKITILQTQLAETSSAQFPNPNRETITLK